jgi:heat shock protein HslJ
MGPEDHPRKITEENNHASTVMRALALPVLTFAVAAGCSKPPPEHAAPAASPPAPAAEAAPAAASAEPPVTHELAGTRWVLTQLGSDPVVPAQGRPEQFIALDSSQQRVAGNAGCNRLIGSYTLEGDQLGFSQMATTRMACPDMERESALLKALEATKSWRIDGAQLDLLDAGANLLARFEARNL